MDLERHIHMADLPEFKSPFLNNVSRRLAARRKALSHQGRLTWETGQPDEEEWFAAYFTPIPGHYVICEFVEGNWVSVRVRSSRRRNRGKILFDLEDINVIDNAHMIVEAMETTICCSHGLDSEHRIRYAESIRAAWSKVEVRVANEDCDLPLPDTEIQ